MTQRKSYRKCDNPSIVARRDRIEQELSSIPVMDIAVKKIISADGFADYYLEMQDLYLTQVEAYERLEDFHIHVTGKRRYAEFSSFRKVLDRRMEKLKLKIE